MKIRDLTANMEHIKSEININLNLDDKKCLKCNAKLPPEELGSVLNYWICPNCKTKNYKTIFFFGRK